MSASGTASPRLRTLELGPARSSSEWRDEALCAGLDGRNGHVDFVEQDVTTQRRFCHGCPVRLECLEDALAVDATLGRFDQAVSVPRAGLTALQRATLAYNRRGAAS